MFIKDSFAIEDLKPFTLIIALINKKQDYLIILIKSASII